ncbi:MAG: ABC transporter permease [Christensenellales bacterium]|jgi:AI-2 transport system permease protein
MKNHFKKTVFRWEFALAIILILEIVVFGKINPRFLKPRVLFGSINDFFSICIISLFVTFVLITGGMDIQAGSIVGLTSISIGVMWNDYGVNIWVACIMGIIIGAVAGAFSGFLIAYTDVQPMVVTLGGSFLYSGLALVVSNLSTIEVYKGIAGFPQAFLAITKGRIFGVVPYQLIMFIILTIIAYFLLHKTKYGRKVFLCGVNRNAAEYCGIHTRKIVMSTYILSGVSAALAGIMLTSYLGTAKTDLGKELTMPIITAVVLGGTSNLGGKGNIIGTALASLVIGILRFGLSMSGMNTQYLDIPVGILLVVSVAVRSIGSNDRIMSFFKRKSLVKNMK